MPKRKTIDPNIRYYPPHLMKKLDFVQFYPLTVLEAPSGFGKTTVLEHYFETCLPENASWQRYDFIPDSQKEIWHHLCQCMEPIDPCCAEKLKGLGVPNEDNYREVEQALRQLQCETASWLWLDNYHTWENPYAGIFLNALSFHGGAQLHVVVSTQPLPADLQQALTNRSQIWQICGEDLLFDQEDTALYFTEAGLSLTHEQIEEVHTLTDGWVMALCLQMMNYLSQGTFTGGNMMTLLDQVFWKYRTEQEQQLLLKLSLIPRFSLTQAAALAGCSQPETESILQGLRYFVRYERQTRSYELHSQLQQFLQEQFEKSEEAVQREYCLQVGLLAQESGRIVLALQLFYRIRDWERLLSVPMTSHDVVDMAALAVQPLVLETLKDCPREVKLRHPRAMLCLALALFIRGENGKLLAHAGTIMAMIREATLPESEKRALQGEMELLLSFLEYNRISDMSVRHQKALELLGGPAELITPQNVWTFGSPSILYLYWRESGKLDEELEEMNRCMPIYYQLTQGHGYGAELVMAAEAMFLRGEVDEALAAVYQARFAARSRQQDSVEQCCLFLQCRIALQQGKPEELEPLLQQVRTISVRHADDLSHYTRDLIESYLALLCGKPEAVSPWLAKGDISDRRLMLMTQPLAHAIYGRYLLTKQEYHKLLGASEYFIGLSSIFPNLLPQVYAHIYCAQALFAMGRRDQAAGRLQKAMDLAFPDRLYLPFAENFGGICTLLPMTSIHGEALDTVTRLSVPFRGNLNVETEPFTDREKSIHYLLREQLTNREIGERLHLSPNTVRNHISTMLRKKGVRTREALQQLPEE